MPWGHEKFGMFSLKTSCLLNNCNKLGSTDE